MCRTNEEYRGEQAREVSIGAELNSLQWVQEAKQAAQEAGIDPALLLAIVIQESSGKEYAISQLGDELTGVGGSVAWDLYGQLAVDLNGLGENLSLGITNMKPSTYNEVVQNYPGPFVVACNPYYGPCFHAASDLAGNVKLDLLASAYYVKLIQSKYVANAPATVTNSYTSPEIVYGIYNGGEQDYVNNVVHSGQFGDNPSKWLPTFDAYYDASQAILDKS